MNTAVAIVIGIIIGFLLEWVVDYFYWRRKSLDLENQLSNMQMDSMNQENQINALMEENKHLRELYGTPTQEVQAQDIADDMVAEGVIEVPDWVPETSTEEKLEAQAEPVPPVEDQSPESIPLPELAESGPQEAHEEVEQLPDEMAPSTVDIGQVEGIQPADQEKLRAAGITTTGDLISRGSTAKGRGEIAAESGVRKSQIMDWVNYAEINEIKGVGGQNANLLKAAGVDTVNKLAASDPGELHEKLIATNAEENAVTEVASEEQIRSWIEQAKQLPSVVAYQAATRKLGG